MSGIGERQCALGLTSAEVAERVGARLPEFSRWMRGQTAAICDGRLYDHDLGEYKQGCANAHGLVVYPWDVDQFLRGGGPLD